MVGSVGQGSSRHSAVWISSAEGAPFTAAPVSDSPAGSSVPGTSSAAAPSSEIDLVTAGGLGYFASGTVGGQPAVWYSTNGLQWSLSSQATRFFDGLDDARIYALFATSGLVYAAGSIGDGTATDAALWSTQDGLDWRAAQPPQGSFSGQGDHVITGVAQLGTGQGGAVGLVAVGGIDAGGVWEPVSWISPDGMTWSQPYASFPESGTAGGVARAVTAVPTLAGTSELFAVGGNDGAQDVWQSSDGMRWSSVALPGPAAASSVWHATLVASNGASIAVADGDPGQAHLLVHSSSGWTEPSDSASQFGPVGSIVEASSLDSVAGKLVLTVRITHPSQAMGPATTTTVSLVSSDGLTWTSAPAATSATAAVAGPPGSNVVGRLGATWIASGTALGSTPGVADAPAVAWTSTDGLHWTSAGTMDPQPGVATEFPAAMCSNSGTVLVVGDASQSRSGTSAAAWYSATGTKWKQAVVSPSAPTGATEWMDGCTSTAGGFVAFGATESSAGSLVPAVWTSPDGTRWTLQDSGAFGRAAPAPLTSLAVSDTRWIAVAGSGYPVATGVAGQSRFNARSAPFGAALLYPPSASGVAVWISSDSGSSWQRVDTADPLWATATGASLEQAAFAGSTAVVVGIAYGRLEVWTGTPEL